MKGKKIILLILVLWPGISSAQVYYQGTQTNNLNSSAIGMSTQATGTAAMASGLNSISSGTAAHAFGMNALASGLYSLAAGYSAQSTGSYSLALGTQVKSTGIRSYTLGSGYATSALVNTISNSLMVGFNSNVPTFFIGTSAGPGTAGKVGIATSAPAARLEVCAGDYDGLLVKTTQGAVPGYGIRCQAQNPETEAFSVLINGDTSLSIKANGSMRIDNTLTAKEVKVRLDVWKDDVLAPAAHLFPLDSLRPYIRQHGHLPGIPPESEALAQPVDLGWLSVALLGKIEEISLYLIELNEKVTNLEKDLHSAPTPTTNTSSP